MALTEKQEKIFKKWIDDHNIPAECEVCKSDEGSWSTGDIVGLPLVIADEEPMAHAPMATLICNGCANVRFFAVGNMKIL